jgi:hypothetical protein
MAENLEKQAANREKWEEHFGDAAKTEEEKEELAEKVKEQRFSERLSLLKMEPAKMTPEEMRNIRSINEKIEQADAPWVMRVMELIKNAAGNKYLLEDFKPEHIDKLQEIATKDKRYGNIKEGITKDQASHLFGEWLLFTIENLPPEKTELDKEYVLGERREMLKKEEELKKRWGIPVEAEGEKSKEELKQAEKVKKEESGEWKKHFGVSAELEELQTAMAKKAEKEQQRQIQKDKEDEEKLTKIEARIEERKKKQEEGKWEKHFGVQAKMEKEKGKTKKFWWFGKKG